MQRLSCNVVIVASEDRIQRLNSQAHLGLLLSVELARLQVPRITVLQFKNHLSIRGTWYRRNKSVCLLRMFDAKLTTGRQKSQHPNLSEQMQTLVKIFSISQLVKQITFRTLTILSQVNLTIQQVDATLLTMRRKSRFRRRTSKSHPKDKCSLRLRLRTSKRD